MKIFARRQLVRLIIAVLAVGTVVITAAIRLKIVSRGIDDVLYDNRRHYLPCEQLPPLAEVEQTLAAHQEVVRQIEAVNPGFTEVEVNVCGTDRAEITFWYGTHAERLAIERLIGADTFFGVPYNLINR